MSSYAYRSDENTRRIERIEFGVWGSEEILRGSALDKDTIGINLPELYSGNDPNVDGLITPYMGVIDKNHTCLTCGLGPLDCPGHFGHITLADPLFNFAFIGHVKKILGCICLKCSKLLVYKNEQEIEDMLKLKTAEERFAEIKNATKNVKSCQKDGYGCGTPRSTIRLDIKKGSVAFNMIAESVMVPSGDDAGKGDGKKIRQVLSGEMCYNILKNMSDTDSMIMGMDPKSCRPEMLMHLHFPVPPVQMRPSAKVDYLASSTMEDDLTHKLSDIVKANNRTRSFKESMNETNEKYEKDHIDLLQYHVATYFDNDSLSLLRSEQRGQAIKSLTSRLKGKKGRVRMNLMGKRVDFSARTVITPDPTIEIDELGIPLKVAMNLTFPEIVTPQNIDRLQQLVRNGRDKYPGANYVFPYSGLQQGKADIIDLRFGKAILRLGDIVERHIINGDPVLLNRQPSLHKLSMMGHRIKVVDNPRLKTFRLNPFVCNPYNADQLF